MALTVDTLRNLTGTGSITLDRQNDGLVAGKHQSLRSFFNIGDARQQNVETLVAIHHAIANDPRFAAPDVRAEAAQLQRMAVAVGKNRFGEHRRPARAETGRHERRLRIRRKAGVRPRNDGSRRDETRVRPERDRA